MGETRHVTVRMAGSATLALTASALLALGRHPYHQHWKPPVTIWASALSWDLWERILLPELAGWNAGRRAAAARYVELGLAVGAGGLFVLRVRDAEDHDSANTKRMNNFALFDQFIHR